MAAGSLVFGWDKGLKPLKTLYRAFLACLAAGPEGMARPRVWLGAWGAEPYPRFPPPTLGFCFGDPPAENF